MICTSIQHKDLQQILDLLSGLEMAEIRLDRCALEEADIEQLFSQSDVPLIATCRLEEESQAPELLELAIRSGSNSRVNLLLGLGILLAVLSVILFLFLRKKTRVSDV